MLVMVACTRERPMPDATATTAIQVNAPPTASQQAEIVTDTPQAGAAPAASSSEAGLAATNTPASLTPAANGTPSADHPSTFQYLVQDGDTLGSIAVQFETDVET